MTQRIYSLPPLRVCHFREKLKARLFGMEKLMSLHLRVEPESAFEMIKL